MKLFKHLFFLVLLTVQVSLSEKIIFIEDFQNQKLPSNFVLINNDGQIPVEGLMNGNGKAWDVARHSGLDPLNYFAVTSSAYGNQVQADDWMILPEILLPDGAWLFWIARSSAIDPARWESYEVLISRTGIDIEKDFTLLFSEKVPNMDTETKNPWFQRKADLSQYAGETVRIAFRGRGVNGFLLFIDDIKVAAHEELDAKLESIIINKYLRPEEHTIACIIYNQGTEKINSIDVSFAVNSGQPITETISDINLESLKSFTYTFKSKAVLENEGISELKIWTSSPNEKTDQNNENDTLTKLLVVVVEETQKNVLMEVFTGTWCGHCPKGMLILNDLTENYENLLPVAVHQDDVMSTEKGNQIIEYFPNGYPSAAFDRVKFPGAVKHGVPYIDNWEQFVQQRSAAPTPVKISVTQCNCWETFFCAIIFTIEFLTDTYGTFKPIVYAIENNVYLDSRYDQRNYANNDPNWTRLNRLGDPIVGYKHQYVLRDIIGGAWGESGKLPKEISKGDKFIIEYSIAPPGAFFEGYDIAQMREISFIPALIEEYDGFGNSEILNAMYAKPSIRISVLDDLNVQVSVYPNPAENRLNIQFPDECIFERLKLIDVLGRELFSMDLNGESEITLERNELPAGVYILQLFGKEGFVARKVIFK